MVAKIGASYNIEMARALPGQVSDTSAYNIDGACVLNDGEILVGTAVQVKEIDSFGDKVVKQVQSGGTPYGVAIRSHFQTTAKDGRMIYENESGINVMTTGRCWMITEDTGAQTFGTAVKLTDQGVVKSDGDVETGWTYTGDFTKFGDIKLAEVQLHQI